VWFVARKKDIIRRRGENISGAEIDMVVGEHPDVVEAAAIGVPAELGEEEVLLAAVKKPGSTLTEKQLGEYCATRLAAFKVPRYILFVDKVPRTPTHRVAKFELRKDATLKSRAVDLTKA
jgi:crotonobetaine/carnitine-CoA ligase